MSTVLYDTPGPRGRRRILIASVAAAIAIAAVVAVVLMRLASHGQLEGERWAVVTRPDLQQLFVQGMLSTCKVWIVSTLVSLVGGTLIAVARLSSQKWLSVPARGVVEVLRGLPTLLLIFFIFLGGPALGLNIPSFWALTIGISLYNVAVLGEIFRAGILALPNGQAEAGYAIGLSRASTLRLVLIPQAARHMMPAIVSQLVIILKESSLGFVVGYLELSRDGRTAVEFLGETYSIPVYTCIAVIYIVAGLLLSRLANWLSGRTSRRYGRMTVTNTPTKELASV